MHPTVIEKRLELIGRMAVVESRPIGPWRARCAEHLAPGEYRYLTDWYPIEPVSHWPPLQTLFFTATVEVPAGWNRASTFFTFSFDQMEGLLRVNDRAWAGLDANHKRVPVPGTGTHTLLAEFLCVPLAWARPSLRSALATFRGGSVVRIDPEVEAAYHDLHFAVQTMNAITDERRKARLSQAVEEALMAVNLAAPRHEALAELSTARQLLKERLAQIAPDLEGGALFLTGHTHIDTAWLWPLKETVRKCARTFSTQCRLMERYPDYHFSCSQAQLYAYTKEHYPDVYAHIRRWVAEGRWETTGAMWVESDANVTSGESLIRQILHGLRFFREEFGTRPTVCWLPDVFGYNAGMPQILAGCGLRSFFTWKLHWQSRNPFPHHLFWWEGIDGTRVLAHIPKLGGGAYNGSPTPEQLTRAWQTYLQKGGYPEQLFPFGYGDGGGGATEEQLEMAQRATGRYPGLPACRQGTAEKFFADVHAAAPDLPVWVGELYLETHRGTYTSQAHTKRGNRRCELALREAEIWGTLSATPHAHHLERLRDRLRALWEKTLLHQFHDILPGTSIGPVYDDTAADHAQVLSEADAVRTEALRQLSPSATTAATHVRLFNALSWERTDLAEFHIPEPPPGPLAASCGGELMPAQVISRRDGKAKVLVCGCRVPSIGAATVTVVPGTAPCRPLRAEGRVLENEFFRLQFAADGSLETLFDKRYARHVLAEGAHGNVLQLFQDGPEREAAWNIRPEYNKRQYPWEDDATIEVVETGPVRAVVRVEKTRGKTRVVQEVTLYESLPRIDFRTRVEWYERQTMLKAAFPLAVRALHATFEVQFGALERPTHRNTSWDEERFEVCGLRWADLSEGGYGVSLLNDGKYGHDVLGNVLRLTLLRGPEGPDPRADEGVHEFTYALLPHAGDWRQGDTVQQAAQLNVPLSAVPVDAEAPPVSYLQVEGPAVLEALKPAEDGDGVILRLYEPNGARGQVTVRHAFPASAVLACNLVEENESELPHQGGCFSFTILPFQVRTFRLRLAQEAQGR
ncbi:MAG: glycoside hydrolase family 38 C-terminal domain-containing protein [Armatimonadota bacterium]|nr:glycoside hydrolase family 38 C-terminal domain-containing protein [Armatimonadota bacterium]